jgi:hypothetical protein
MRGITVICFLLTVIVAHSQTPDNYIFFSGYVFDQDSLPVEGAILINFRTLKADITNKDGFFKTFLGEADSLLINHISYDRKIIKANNLSSSANKFYLIFSTNEIKTVSVNYWEQVNLENNMNIIHLQMKENTPLYKTKTEYNPYIPEQKRVETGINIFELISIIKTYKYRKSRENRK